MSLAKFFYNLNMRKKPVILTLQFEFFGKGSNDCLYITNSTIPFDKPLKKEYCNDDGIGAEWNARHALKEAYKQILSSESKKALVEARKEKYIVAEEGNRITGEYIVAVDYEIYVKEWAWIPYEEWVTLE